MSTKATHTFWGLLWLSAAVNLLGLLAAKLIPTVYIVRLETWTGIGWQPIMRHYVHECIGLEQAVFPTAVLTLLTALWLRYVGTNRALVVVLGLTHLAANCVYDFRDGRPPSWSAYGAVHGAGWVLWALIVTTVAGYMLHRRAIDHPEQSSGHFFAQKRAKSS